MRVEVDKYMKVWRGRKRASASGRAHGSPKGQGTRQLQLACMRIGPLNRACGLLGSLRTELPCPVRHHPRAMPEGQADLQRWVSSRRRAPRGSGTAAARRPANHAPPPHPSSLAAGSGRRASMPTAPSSATTTARHQACSAHVSACRRPDARAEPGAGRGRAGAPAAPGALPPRMRPGFPTPRAKPCPRPRRRARRALRGAGVPVLLRGRGRLPGGHALGRGGEPGGAGAGAGGLTEAGTATPSPSPTCGRATSRCPSRDTVSAPRPLGRACRGQHGAAEECSRRRAPLPCCCQAPACAPTCALLALHA